MKRRHAALLVPLAVLLVWGIGLIVSTTADPSTTKDLTKLLNADVGEDVVLAYIQKNGVPEKVTVDEIVALKKAGATPAVLLALMGGKVALSGGEFPFDLDDNHSVGAPIVHGPMAVYPILRKGPASVQAYLTLDEAVEQKVLVISEKDGGSVPVVVILNNAKLPVYISAGEIIVGGKQDRMVAYDVIVSPAKQTTVEVRCVEHGRWSGADVKFSSGNAMAGNRAKMAVQFRGQQEVWDEVAAQNGRANAGSDTGSLQATLSNPDVQKLWKEYSDHILPKLEGRNLVGFVVAINGKVHALELFGGPGLFTKMKEKLLKAYVLDVVGLKDEKAPPPSKDKILAFYKETLKVQAADLKKYDDNRVIKREGADAAGSDNLDTDGNLLHRNFLSR